MVTFATLAVALLLGIDLVRQDLVRQGSVEAQAPLARFRTARVVLLGTAVVLLAPRLWELVT